MTTNKFTNDRVKELVDEISRTYKEDVGINFIDATNLPVRDKIVEILELRSEIIFPGYTGKRTVTKSNIGFIVGDLLCEVYSELCEQIERAYKYRCRMENCDTGDCKRMAEEAAAYLVEQLPR